MVFFTCYGCNEALKKNQVEKHKFKCRRSHTVSCIDCLKDFHGNEFEAHNKCMSEDQKYGGQNYVLKENKGEVKQERWFEIVQKAIDLVAQKHDQRVQQVLQSVRNYPNIPQKEKKFKNFLLNSMRIRDDALLSRAWAAISNAAADLKKQQEREEALQMEKLLEATTENDDKEKIDSGSQNSDAENLENKKREHSEAATDEDDAKKKKKKVKLAEPDETTQNGSISSSKVLDLEKKPSLKTLIKRFLKDAPNNEMKLKRLKKSIAKEMGVSDESGDDAKLKLGKEIDDFLSKNNTKYATDNKIVKFAIES